MADGKWQWFSQWEPQRQRQRQHQCKKQMLTSMSMSLSLSMKKTKAVSKALSMSLPVATWRVMFELWFADVSRVVFVVGEVVRSRLCLAVRHCHTATRRVESGARSLPPRLSPCLCLCVSEGPEALLSPHTLVWRSPFCATVLQLRANAATTRRTVLQPPTSPSTPQAQMKKGRKKLTAAFARRGRSAHSLKFYSLWAFSRRLVAEEETNNVTSASPTNR